MQQYTRETAIEKLLDGYRSFYNITRYDEAQLPMVALCEFFEHAEKYVLSRKANLWSAESEEFVYLFTMDNLSLDDYEKYRDYAHKDGMSRAHIGPGHMYTYITPIFICNTCDEDARKALKKCKIYKSFHFSLHGWMDFHTAVLEINRDYRITTNGSGKCVGKILKNVLFQKKKKRRRFL